MDWKLLVSFGALFVSLVSWFRTETRGHALRCQSYDEGQWVSLRKEIEGRRDEFEKLLSQFRVLTFEDNSLEAHVTAARECYKELIKHHGLLLRSAKRCSSSTCTSQHDEWASVALRPIVNHDTVIDQTGEAFNAITASSSSLDAVIGISIIFKLFDQMLDELDTVIRIENAHHDPAKHSPFSWLPFIKDVG